MTTRLGGGAPLSERQRAERASPPSIQQTTGCAATLELGMAAPARSAPQPEQTRPSGSCAKLIHRGGTRQCEPERLRRQYEQSAPERHRVQT